MVIIHASLVPDSSDFSVGSPSERVAAVRERIAVAAARSGRSAQAVRLLAVVKFQPVDAVRAVVDAGVRLLGGNYVQESVDCRRELGEHPGVEWHLIGGLQANKARAAVRTFDCVQTVDRSELATRLGRIAVEEGKVLPVLVQVDLAGTAGRSGVQPDQLKSLCEQVASTDGLDLRGLMGVPPPSADPEAARPCFAKMREWFEKLPPAHRHELSMGMSADYTVAVEEGATLVRVGSALFGPRQPKE
jgi:pyridoxal phosphate enzyme (YggS family)